MLGWIPCGLVVSKRKLILTYGEKEEEGTAKKDHLGTTMQVSRESRIKRNRREGGQAQKHIIDTMFDEACSNSRKVGACHSTLREPSKRLRRVDVYLLSAISKTSNSSLTSNSIYWYRGDRFLLRKDRYTSLSLFVWSFSFYRNIIQFINSLLIYTKKLIFMNTVNQIYSNFYFKM